MTKPVLSILGAMALGGLLHAPTAIAAEGIASFYGKRFHGRTTASGQPFDQHAMTAAHRTLGFGTRVRVTHLRSRRSVVVTITDRGPYIKGRIIDLSRGAASRLGILGSGVARVRLEVLGRERIQRTSAGKPAGGLLDALF